MMPSRFLHDVADLSFRVLFSLIFLGAGLMHLVRPQELATRLLDAPMSWLATAVAPASLLILLSGVILVPASLGLLLGFCTRPAAVLLLIVLVPITITVDVGNPKNMGPLFKNIALFGGLIHFAVRDAGAYALDNLRRRDRMRFLRTSGKSCSAVSGPQ
jgi:putative oxidoreductase